MFDTLDSILQGLEGFHKKIICDGLGESQPTLLVEPPTAQ